MAVGWLEKNHEFTQGLVDPHVLEKLKSLRQEFAAAFPAILYRGLHSCSLCAATDSRSTVLRESHINLFVPTRGFVYTAPGRIDHYIEAHGYAPPESFSQAVLDCPSPSSADYRARIAASNRNCDAPLFKDR